MLISGLEAGTDCLSVSTLPRSIPTTPDLLDFSGKKWACTESDLGSSQGIGIAVLESEDGEQELHDFTRRIHQPQPLEETKWKSNHPSILLWLEVIYGL